MAGKARKRPKVEAGTQKSCYLSSSKTALSFSSNTIVQYSSCPAFEKLTYYNLTKQMAGLPPAGPAAAPAVPLGWLATPFRQMTLLQKAVYKAIYGARPPRPRSRYPGVWKGGRELGEGSEGVTCLWVQEDPTNHHILDRVCLKDCQMDFATYHDPEMYIRDARVDREYCA